MLSSKPGDDLKGITQGSGRYISSTLAPGEGTTKAGLSISNTLHVMYASYYDLVM